VRFPFISAVLAACLSLWMAGCGGGGGGDPSDDEPADSGEDVGVVEETRRGFDTYGRSLSQAPGRTRADTGLMTLQHTINAYAAGEGELPSSLDDLVSSGYMSQMPKAPEGMRFAYDPATGVASLEPR